MKAIVVVLFLMPGLLLLIGSNDIYEYAPPSVSEDPVVVQIKNLEHPFDVGGRFPYVILIDNVVYKFDSSDVEQFISKRVTIPGPVSNRIRFVTTNTN